MSDPSPSDTGAYCRHGTVHRPGLPGGSLSGLRFAVKDLIDVAGVPVDRCADQLRRPLTAEDRAALDAGVRRAADHIIDGKGHTAFGIGGGLSRIVAAIAGDERAVLTCSVLNDSVLGVPEVALSLPRVVGRQGVLDTVMPHLSDEEAAALKRSAEILKEAAMSVEKSLS